jgi:hypothetical protein
MNRPSRFLTVTGSGFAVGEAVAVGLGEQLAERCGGGGLVGAGLPEQGFLASDRIGSCLNLDPEQAARQALYMTSVGHSRTIARSGLIGPTRSTDSNAGVLIILSAWEPPIGIEPMTYALRGGLWSSTAVQAVTLPCSPGFLVRPCP